MSVYRVMMRKNVFFYIIVPVYNNEKYVRTCIESVLNQTYQNYQMIMVDDGSTDRSGYICDKYAESNKQIVVIHQENKGLYATRQVGIKYMLQNSGDMDGGYMISLDSDDFMEKDALEKIADIIRNYECDMVCYDLAYVKKGEVVREHRYRGNFEGLVTDKRILYQKTILEQRYASVAQKAVALSVISGERKYTTVDIAIGEDAIQSLDYYRNARKVYFLPETLYNYTVNPNSLTHSQLAIRYRDQVQKTELMWDFLESENLFTEADWGVYRAAAMGDIAWIATHVCRMKEDKRGVAYRLKEIRESNLYVERIEGEWKSTNMKPIWKMICAMLDKECYGGLYYIGRVYNLLVMFRRAVRL